MYRLNCDVDNRNSEMLNTLVSHDDQVKLKSSDSICGQNNHISLSRLSDKRSETRMSMVF